MTWRLRYSLRGLMLAALLIAVGAAWFAAEFLEPFRAEATVLRQLASIGCDVETSPRTPQWFWRQFGQEVAMQATWVDLSHMPVGDAELSQMAHLSGLEGLYLDDTNVTDLGLTHLQGRSGLVALSLRNTSIRRPPPLEGMYRLLHLDLSNTSIDRFAGDELYALEYLSLAGTQVSGETLARLQRMPNLRTLDLSRNRRITDAGVAHLNRRRFPRLTRIYLWETRITAAGAAGLAAEFPGAAVNWDSSPAAPGAERADDAVGRSDSSDR